MDILRQTPVLQKGKHVAAKSVEAEGLSTKLPQFAVFKHTLVGR